MRDKKAQAVGGCGWPLHCAGILLERQAKPGDPDCSSAESRPEEEEWTERASGPRSMHRMFSEPLRMRTAVRHRVPVGGCCLRLLTTRTSAVERAICCVNEGAAGVVVRVSNQAAGRTLGGVIAPRRGIGDWPINPPTGRAISRQKTTGAQRCEKLLRSAHCLISARRGRGRASAIRSCRGGRVRVSRERGRRWADAARQRVGWTDGAGYGRRVPVVALETVVAVVAVVAGVA